MEKEIVLNEQFNKTNTLSQNMMFQMCITMPFSHPTMKSAHENIRSNLVNKTILITHRGTRHDAEMTGWGSWDCAVQKDVPRVTNPPPFTSAQGAQKDLTHVHEAQGHEIKSTGKATFSRVPRNCSYLIPQPQFEADTRTDLNSKNQTSLLQPTPSSVSYSQVSKRAAHSLRTPDAFWNLRVTILHESCS